MGHLRHFGGPIRHLRGHLRHIVEPMVGVGTRSQIQVTLRNEYFLCKNFKIGFGFFVP